MRFDSSGPVKLPATFSGTTGLGAALTMVAARARMNRIERGDMLSSW